MQLFWVWLFNGVIAGVLVGNALGGGRLFAFTVMVGAAMPILIAEWRSYLRVRTEPIQALPAGEVQAKHLDDAPNHVGFGARHHSDEFLSEAAAREWLDDFLVKQQEK